MDGQTRLLAPREGIPSNTHRSNAGVATKRPGSLAERRPTGSARTQGSQPPGSLSQCMRRYDRCARVDKLAKSADLKSAARKSLRVRIPSRAFGRPGARPAVQWIESRAMSTESAQETETFHGGRLIARRLKAHGVSKLFTLSGGHLFSIYDGCREEGIEIVDVRHESTAAFAAEGWAKVTREPGGVRADGRARRDQRHERDGLGAGQPLADGRPRRPRARDALGAGLAAGDRPRPVRAAADQARGDGRRAPRRSRASSTTPSRRRSRRTAARRSWTSRWTTCSWRPRSRRARTDGAAQRPPRARAAAGAVERAGGAAARGRAAGDHGRHGPLLGPRRGGAAGAGRGAADPGLPQRPGARLRAGRPRAVLLAGPLAGAERAPTWRS